MCPFCKSRVEAVNHLFLECYCIWRIWMRCCNLWGVSWVIPSEPVNFFMAWQHYDNKSGNRQIWRLAFFAILWSIWLYRNEMVFNGKSFDELELLTLIKWRLACWIKAKWPDSAGNWQDVFRLPSHVQVFQAVRKARQVKWTPPRVGLLKLNVDGSSKGKPGPAGIGGVLKDEIGRKLMEFSKSIGVCEANKAEIMAIKEALYLFSASKWRDTHGLIVESDSKNAVKWISDPNDAPWKVRKWIAHVITIMYNCVSFNAQHVMREANGEADMLAKAGVSRSNPLIHVYT